MRGGLAQTASPYNGTRQLASRAIGVTGMFYGLSKSEQERLHAALNEIDKLYQRVFHADHLITVMRCMGFFEDERFMAAYRKAAQTDQERSLVWRLHTLTWAAGHCAALEGDFVECGVYRGFSSAVIIDYLKFQDLERRFYLYDTFSGIPEAYREGSSAPEGGYEEEGLHEKVRGRFAAYPNVQVVQGVVPDCFDQICPERIAYLHLDLNSHQAELGALEVMFDRVTPGGMIVLDDYGWQWYRAQKEAEDAFMRKRGYAVLELPTGQGLVVKR
jgi:O-methyltransferase